MGIAYSCCSRKKIILFYAVLAVVFYISVITGCSLQLTLPKNDAGWAFVIGSILLMVLAGICVAASILLVIGIFVESPTLILVWLVSVFLTNVYTLVFTFFTLGASESVLSNMAFDITMAAIFMVGVILVSFAYISIRSSVQSAMSHNVYNHQQKAKLQFSSASRSTTINSQREKEETCQLNSQDTATTL